MSLYTMLASVPGVEGQPLCGLFPGPEIAGRGHAPGGRGESYRSRVGRVGPTREKIGRAFLSGGIGIVNGF